MVFPESVAVPFPLSVSVSHEGRLIPGRLVADYVHLGDPVVVMVKLPGWPTDRLT